MDLTLTFPTDVSPAEVASVAEELQHSAGIRLLRPDSESLGAVDWHSIPLAVGGASGIHYLYQVIQSYLNQRAKRKLTVKCGNIEIIVGGGEQTQRVEEIIKALAPFESKQREQPRAAKKAKKATKKAAKKQAGQKRPAKGR